MPKREYNPYNIFQIKSLILAKQATAIKIKHMVNTDEIARWVYQSLQKDAEDNPAEDWKDIAWLAFIRSVITNKVDQRNHEQIDLFSDSEFVFTVRDAKSKTSQQVSLWDLNIEAIEQVQRQKDSNIETAQNEADRFRAAAALVVPLLKENPTWRWGDAAEFLVKSGVVAEPAE